MTDPASSPGLVAALRRLAAHIAALLATRAELASLELQQMRERVLRWTAMVVIAAILLLAALMTLSLWLAAVFWDGPRGWALGLLAAGYLALAAGLLLAVRRAVERGPPLFAQTRAELLKDRDALRARASAPTSIDAGTNDGAG